MSEEQNLVTFRTVGRVVRFDPQAKMWSLTEMHAASDADESKAPAQWLSNAQTAEYLVALLIKCAGEAHLKPETDVREAHLTDVIDVREAHLAVPPRPTGGRDGRAALAQWAQSVKEIAAGAGLIETRRGSDGGTWAHWQIAAAYAHYLDPHFYLQWNEWAMAHITGQAPVTPRALAALESRLAALEARLGEGAPPPMRFRRVTERIVEEIELRDVPRRPWTQAIHAALLQSGRPLRPIEVTALLQAAGVDIDRLQVSRLLWQLTQDGRATRDDDGRYHAA